jgi:hypothetical protein
VTRGAVVAPPWDTPLEVEQVLASVPEAASIAGMFFIALQEGAERRQVPRSLAKSRYLPFGFYPVREFAPLLVEAAELHYAGAHGSVKIASQRDFRRFAAGMVSCLRDQPR